MAKRSVDDEDGMAQAIRSGARPTIGDVAAAAGVGVATAARVLSGEVMRRPKRAPRFWPRSTRSVMCRTSSRATCACRKATPSGC